jgi:hypothetical protein
MNRAELERRARLWQRHHRLRVTWLSLAAGLAAASVPLRADRWIALAVGIVVAAAALVLLRRRIPPVTAETVAAHLNRACPPLEESAALWLHDPDTLPLVERLQLRRIDAAWSALPDRATVGCPRVSALRPAAGVCVAALALLAVVTFWPRLPASAVAVAPVAPSLPSAPVAPRAAPILRAAALEITPPAYLGSGPRRIDGLDADVAEGSGVTWDLAFTGDVAGVALAFAQGPGTVDAEPAGAGRFRARVTVADTQLYQLAITLSDGRRVRWPDVHAIKAIRDQPPRLTWQEPTASRTVLDPARDEPRVSVRVVATDDHGIADVTLLATVAKGSGEGVKFRDQVIPLAREGAAGTPGDSFGQTLDLAALGLEPGDELYFHAVATDRRTPEPNRTRSETRFVVWRGPETSAPPPGAAIAGVNRLPAYFRSQRQLIIDTERLVAEQPGLSAETFRARSDDIGVDQKLLRLRYGEFLGEEFEPASSGAPREAQGMALAGALRSPSRDARDALQRAAAVERAVEAQHAHPTTPSAENRTPTVEELMAPFVHVHDNPEAATLFDTHVKTALRAVLAAMWEAEGFLRTGRPADALPAENRALELLKALQQADRIYAARIGYEPAPLKVDERRLRGELDRIPRRAVVANPAPQASADAAALTEAISTLGATTPATVPPDLTAQVEARLVAAAQERPETYVTALELWRRPDVAVDPAQRETLLRALWSLAPPGPESPHRPVAAVPTLNRDYLDALDSRGGVAR